MRINFWQWLIDDWKAQMKLILGDRYVFFHILGALLFGIKIIDPTKFATTILLPFASIIIGISFAWGGNAVALLSDGALQTIAEQHKKGFENYVYKFLLSILILLGTLVCWLFVATGIFCGTSSILSNIIFYFILMLSSIALREVWHVILGVQYMLLWKYHINRK